MHENCFSGLFAFGGLLAQSGSSAPAPGLLQSPLVFMVLIGVMMYFAFIRPQQQRNKQLAKMLAALKPGDKVVTAAGIVGTVITMKDKEKTLTLRSNDAKLEVTKASITEVIASDANTPTAS